MELTGGWPIIRQPWENGGGVCVTASGGYGPYASESICAVITDNDAGIIETATAGAGTPSVAVGFSGFATDASSIDQLAGAGTTGGASVGYTEAPLGIGGDVGSSPDGKTHTYSAGVSVGYATGPGELHGGASESRILWKGTYLPR